MNPASLATPPPQHAPRPMTLPTRGAASRMRNRVLELNGTCRTSIDDNCNQENCESPSYLVNTHSSFYKFPEGTDGMSDPNPVPLPPRDGKKHIKTNAKRHVRKFPLIIPANGVQRTLNKVTERTPTEEEQKWPTQRINSCNNNNNNPNASNLQRVTHEVVATVRPTSISTGKTSATNVTSDAIYQNGVIEQQLKAIANVPKVDPTYMNLEQEKKCSDAIDTTTHITATDTASLQFESIMEADFDKSLVLQSPDVTDGFYNFSIQKEHYNKSKGVDYDPAKMSKLYANEDELRNLDIEHSVRLLTPPLKQSADKVAAPTTTSAPTIVKSTNTAVEGNELADNALFRKVRQTVEQSIHNTPSTTTNKTTAETTDTCASELEPDQPAPRKQTEAEYFAATAARLADSNSVSCEDLLEFADQKPKGRERGPDSDEVRIMTKVLGNQCTAVRCLAALESIDWDVHKAIKLIKLQNILPACELSFAEAGEALQQYDWDLHMTVLKLRGVKT